MKLVVMTAFHSVVEMVVKMFVLKDVSKVVKSVEKMDV